MSIMVLHLAEELGPVLVGRTDAARMRDRVLDAPDDGGAVVDFAGIEVVSPSFADEFFAKLPAPLLESGQVRLEPLNQRAARDSARRERTSCAARSDLTRRRCSPVDFNSLTASS